MIQYTKATDRHALLQKYVVFPNAASQQDYRF